MTVLFENVSLPHALLVPKKSNVLDLVTRNYCFFKTPKITFWPLSDLYWPWITWPFCLKLFPYHMHFLSQRNQMCWILSLGVVTPKWPLVTLDHMTVLFENVSLPHALLVPKKSSVSDLVNRSYCFFKNAQNHALTPKSPLLTLDHMTVLFENVSLPHALLVPKKSNVSDLVNRSYCFLKTPKITIWPLFFSDLGSHDRFVWKCFPTTCTSCPKEIKCVGSCHQKLLLFQNAQNHVLTPKWPLLTLDHMTVLFEIVSLPHALLVPKKSNVLDLVIRSCHP